MGGENGGGCQVLSGFVGSSPRGRGKRGGHDGWSFRLGLIPAWAGKTAVLLGHHRADGAHPRVGGENALIAASVRFAVGSSPRGRGKPLRVRAPRDREGLIPAWAGKTDPHRAYRPHDGAHPRVGGENRRSCLICSMILGSSPRGRGKRRRGGRRRGGRRLIPAWAGKTIPA